MRERLRHAPIAVGLLVVVAVVFLLGFDPEPSDPPTEVADGPQREGEAGALRSDARPGPQLQTRPAAPAPAQGPVPAERPGAPSVTVDVVGADGTPVERAVIRLVRDADGRPSEEASGQLGAWDLDVPATLLAFPGSTWIEVSQPRGPDGGLPLRSGWSGPHESNAAQVQVVLPTDYRIQGTVVSAAGAPVAGVRLRARTSKAREAFSDAEGAFDLGPLPRRRILLKVWARGPNAAPPPIPVEVGTTDLVVPLLRGIEASLTVVGPDGKPLPQAVVQVGESTARGTATKPDEVVTRGLTDASGRVLLDALNPARRYALEVVPPHARKDLVAHWQPRWQPGDEVIRLDPSLEVRGRVTYPDGRPCAGAEITVRSARPRKTVCVGTCGADGRFTVQRVPHGRVTVYASRIERDGAQWRAASVDATAGASHVTLVLHPDPIGSVQIRLLGAGDARVRVILRPEDRRMGWAAVRRGLGSRKRPLRLDRVYLRRRYTLYAVSDDKTLCAYVPGVVPESGSVDVRLGSAQWIRGRLEGPANLQRPGVTVRGPGFIQAGTVSPQGHFAVGGLPAGTWMVRAYAWVERATLSAHGECKTGATIELTLE